jgi:hypothetical protein
VERPSRCKTLVSVHSRSSHSAQYSLHALNHQGWLQCIAQPRSGSHNTQNLAQISMNATKTHEDIAEETITMTKVVGRVLLV